VIGAGDRGVQQIVRQRVERLGGIGQVLIFFRPPAPKQRL